MLADAIESLVRDSQATACPVCEQSIDAPTVVERLRHRVAGAARDKHAGAQAEITNISAERYVLAEAQRARSGLLTTLAGASDRMNEVLLSGRSTLELPPDADVRAVSAAVAREIATLAAAITAQEELLQRAEGAIDRLRATARVLAIDADFAAVRAKGAVDEPGDSALLDEELDRLTGLQASLEEIARGVTSVARSRVRDAVDGSREAIARYYRELCRHPFFDGLSVDVGERTVQGMRRNSYAVRVHSTSDSSVSLASTRLSTAQMNSVALSVYLALTTALTHNLGFVVLDDPSQNLDVEHKTALVSILAAITERTQVVVATQDLELQGLLRQRLLSEGSCAYELRWARTGVTATQAR